MLRNSCIALALLLAAGAAFAGSCPKRMNNIDQALEAGALEGMDTQRVEQIRSLRASGEELHQSGRHGASVDALMKAEKLLGIAD